MLGASRRTGGHAPTTPLRGIHQSMFAYAFGNNDYLPGFSPQGELTAPSVEERFSILLNGDYFNGDYPINHLEYSEVIPWKPNQSSPPTPNQYSFSMLQISKSGSRQKAWRAEIEPTRALMSDRNTGTDTQENINSLASNKPGQWHGYVLWADNHVTFQNTAIAETDYDEDPSTTVKADHLFEAEGSDDAYMIHSGE